MPSAMLHVVPATTASSARSHAIPKANSGHLCGLKKHLTVRPRIRILRLILRQLPGQISAPGHFILQQVDLITSVSGS